MANTTLIISTSAFALASAGVAVGTAAPAAAADRVQPVGFSQDPVSGYVEAYGAFGHWSLGDSGSTYESEGFTSIGGAGRLNWWVSPTHTLQVDAYGNGASFDSSENDGDTAMALAAHYGWRGMPTGNIAVMGSIGQDDGTRFTTLAIEGQLHGSNWTLYGQGGFTSAVGGSSISSAPYAAVQGRYFFNQNFEAAADVTLSDIGGRTYSQFGAGLELKPTSMPFSLFARGQIQTLTSGPFKFSSTEALFGVKLFVNQPSLWSNDVNGATYLDLNPIYGEFANKFALD